MLDPSAPVGFVCGACRRRPPPWELLLAGWFYEPPLREVVRGLKYGRLEYLAAALAEELAGRFGPELGACRGVVAVPLHWRRRLTRGYNQAALMARALSTRLDRPLVGGLVRRRATRAQTGLDRAARQRNLRHAFAWRGPRPGGRASAEGPLLLVDDVYTTGATLESAARVLRRSGARRVLALVAAATPGPEIPPRKTHRASNP